ncbi:protein of unknown function [Methylorubrum extorquens]|uniref:Uncharacterized protein n=1 Tax=Methylorubrum extorquens TaxID=408 RepID=A0A2N9AHC2_METEX|nr:protein of unknown function [Methylorubrum extorquens]
MRQARLISCNSTDNLAPMTTYNI